MASSDLISLDRALAVFSPPLDSTAQATIPALVTAATKAIERHARRTFALTTYDEIRVPRAGQWDRGEPDYVPLRWFPVQAITRVAGARQQALTITNTDRATNQRATVAPVITGDPEIQTTATGLTLAHTASAVTTTATLAFTDYPTLTTLAEAVNALGAGWKATVQAGLGAYAAADLVPGDGPQGALSNPVTLDLFAQDLATWRLDPTTGGIYLAATTAAAGGPGAPWYWPQSSGMDFLSGSWRPEVRVSYTAGWATIPEPVQQACAITVQQMYFDQLIPNLFQSETMGSYSYQVNEPDLSIPASARDLLAPYVIYRF